MFVIKIIASALVLAFDLSSNDWSKMPELMKHFLQIDENVSDTNEYCTGVTLLQTWGGIEKG